jgi:hypothetical protein
MSAPSEQLENLRGAYQILKRNVIRTLRTQRIVEMQLNRQIDEVFQFSAVVQMVCLFPSVPSYYFLKQSCSITILFPVQSSQL